MTTKAELAQAVYKTNDYFLFKIISGNRSVNKLNLSRLIKSIKERYLFTVIIVNEKYEIIDGQHRFEAVKALNLPLYYIICKGYGLNEVHRLNTNAKTWTAEDFLNGYCDLGLVDYLEFKAFKNKYGLGYNETISMLRGAPRGNGRDFVNFKDGAFKITHAAEGKRCADKIMKVGQYYDGFKRRSFVYAMLTLFKNKKFDFDEFLKKIKNNPASIVNCSDTEQYLTLIEKIYNYRRKDKVNLRY